MECEHMKHMDSSPEMMKPNQSQSQCAICSKPAFDMSKAHQKLDKEIEGTPMPEEYLFEVSILCDDCDRTSKASFHIFGHRCNHCSSFSTRVIGSDKKDQ